MNFRSLLITATGAGLIFAILESRRQRALSGETPAEAIARDEQAASAFREIMRDVQRDELSDVLTNGGSSTAGITLETFNEFHPTIAQPLLNAYNGIRAFRAFNSAISSSPLAALASGNFAFPGLTVATITPSSHAVLPAPTTLQNRLEAIGFDLALVPDEFKDSITANIMDDPVEAKTVINANGTAIEASYLYERSTYERLNGTCPQNRQPFIEFVAKPDLKSKIQQFVDQKVKEYGERLSNGSSHSSSSSSSSASTPRM